MARGQVIPRLLDLQINESHHTSVGVIEEEDWRKPLIEYLKHGKLPEDPRQRTDIKLRAPRFIFYKGTLFHCSFEGLFLRCLGKEEAHQAMEEVHSGSCGAHQSGPKLHFRIKRMGYYWPTMVKDYLEHAKRCQVFQFHANYIHQPPDLLHPTAASWTFDAWGLGVKKVVAKNKRDWHEKIGEALWAYRTTFRTATQATPYSLVYGIEAVLPLEKQIPSLRITIQEGLTSEENAQLCLADLEALDEKRLEAQ
nr:uncharacterized protein LOC117276811 [Nicotiana tomentosiformis]